MVYDEGQVSGISIGKKSWWQRLQRYGKAAGETMCLHHTARGWGRTAPQNSQTARLGKRARVKAIIN